LKRLLLGAFLLFVLGGTSLLQAVFSHFASNIKVIRAQSISQNIIDQNTIVFKGNVHILIDHRLQIRADTVTFDKTAQIITATAEPPSSVVLEDKNFLTLATSLTINLKNKSGTATGLRLHVDEGYIAAATACKVNDADWEMRDIVYTACDGFKPHWHIAAHKATVQGGYFIKIENLSFNIGNMTVLSIPRFVIPIQGQSKSGFLIPRFTVDYAYGFGFKQDYYHYISPHCDTTFGIDWRYNKGVIFANEFRLGMSAESFSDLRSEYAVVRDRYIQKDNKIVKSTTRGCWVRGKDFRILPQVLGATAVNTLARIDAGSDRMIGYHFFTTTDDVEDTFCNSALIRLWYPTQLITCGIIDNTRTSRTTFFPIALDQAVFDLSTVLLTDKPALFKKSIEDSAEVTTVPQLAFNTTAWLYGPLSYRHDATIDQALYRQIEVERLFVNTQLLLSSEPLPLQKIDLIRGNYSGRLACTLPVGNATITAHAAPRVQYTSHRLRNQNAHKNVYEQGALAHGAYRFFMAYGAEMALPEQQWVNESAQKYFLQSRVHWDYMPYFDQSNWYYFDYLDRTYATHEIAWDFKNIWQSPAGISATFDISQGYDFYPSEKRFNYERSFDRYSLPLRYDFLLQFTTGGVAISQEFDWKRGALLQSQIGFNFQAERFSCNLQYVFQKRSIQYTRDLLGRIPHFLTMSLALPLTSHVMLSYEAQLYAPKHDSLFSFTGVQPLIHRVRLDYEGHCWGCYIGFEQKKYKECSIGRNEQAIVFCLRLDSLGSFANRFKSTPQVERAQA
jgi:hypothetical protein